MTPTPQDIERAEEIARAIGVGRDISVSLTEEGRKNRIAIIATALASERERWQAMLNTAEGALELCSRRSLTIERERDNLASEIAQLREQLAYAQIGDNDHQEERYLLEEEIAGLREALTIIADANNVRLDAGAVSVAKALQGVAIRALARPSRRARGRRKVMSKQFYDVKCRELAEYFLSDASIDPPGGRYPMNLEEEKLRAEDLACHIQQAVEDWWLSFTPAGGTQSGGGK